MNLQLDLTEFLEFATYNKLFDSVVLSPTMAAQVALADPDKKLCVCEPTNDLFTTVWYPVDSWIAECKRRSSIEKAIAEERAKPKPIKKEDTSTLTKQLLVASMNGNEAEVKRIMELMK